MRAHFVAYLTDTDGDAIAGADVFVYAQGTSNPVAGTIYRDDDSVGVVALANPMQSATDGKIEFFRGAPERVDLFIQAAGHPDRRITVDVLLAQVGTIQILKEGGVPLTTRAGVNFVAADFDLADDAGNNETDVALATMLRQVAEEGVPLTARNAVNFIGSAVSAVDNAGQNRTDVTITVPSADVTTLPIRSENANYNAVAADCVILMDASGGARTVNLPTAVGIAGKVYHVKKTDSSGNAVTIDPNGAQTVDGSGTYAITVQYQSISVISDGANWRIF